MIIQVTEKHLGKRILAFSLDYLIIFTLTYIYMYFFGVENGEGGYKITGIKTFVPFAIWTFFTIGLEQILGSTLGHYLLELRTVPIDKPKEKLELNQSIKKHFFDLFDMMFFLGIILINVTKNNQRLGDIIANTIVISTSNSGREKLTDQ